VNLPPEESPHRTSQAGRGSVQVPSIAKGTVDFLASRGQILRAENLDTFSDIESTADGNKIRIPTRLLALDELGYIKVLVSTRFRR
jgi:hypothetical protein